MRTKTPYALLSLRAASISSGRQAGGFLYLSRLTNVNRRSVYNWFNQQHLKPEIIFRIGCALKHDFSVEFPHLFSKEDFKSIYEGNEADKQSQSEQVAADNWKDKYIHLLEQYNNLLLNHLKKNKSL